MTACRVCGAHIAEAAYEASAPALTTTMAFVDIPTLAFVCDECGHAQSGDLPDIEAFYDTSYQISMESDDHDQIFAVGADNRPIYRTDHQAAVSLRLLDLPQNAAILDYGAAKSTTLRKMHRARPDLRPHVFDVSADYAPAWQGWVAVEDQASYKVPPEWSGRFQAVMSHFVIEHVTEPVAFLEVLHGLLAPEGRLLVSMPDVAANPGDMAVADHLNHFSAPSLKRAFAMAGFCVETIDRDVFPGAFFVVARRVNEPVTDVADKAEIIEAAAKAREICAFWKQAAIRLDGAAKEFAGRRAAIYGSGFYGSWICSRIGKDVDLSAFLDQNPNLQGASHFGRPVLAPASIGEDVEVVFVGLNPLKAKAAIAQQPSLHRPGLNLVWIDA